MRGTVSPVLVGIVMVEGIGRVEGRDRVWGIGCEGKIENTIELRDKFFCFFTLLYCILSRFHQELNIIRIGLGTIFARNRPGCPCWLPHGTIPRYARTI